MRRSEPDSQESAETNKRPASLSAVTPRHYPPAGQPRERAAVPGRAFARPEPTTLDQDMTRADLIWSLEHLNFGRDSVADRRTRAVIALDCGVRDFLVRAIRPR
jgi:hypothetical protein